MRKLLLVSGVLLLLSGCSFWGKDTNLSYNDLRQQFLEQNFSSPLFSTILGWTWSWLREKIQLQIQWEDDAVGVQFTLRGQKDYSGADAMGSYLYDLHFVDKIARLPINGSGDVLYISKDGKEYLRTNTTKIDMWTGNAEGVMVQLIVDALSKKWLNIDKPDFIQTWMFSLPIDMYVYDLPLWLHKLFAGAFLSPRSQASNSTYSVDGSYDSWNKIMPISAASWFVFGGSLGIKNTQPTFDLERFILEWWKGIGNLSMGKGNLVLQSGDTTYTIAWEDGAYGAINLVVNYTVSGSKQRQIAATLRQKLVQDGSLIWAAKWTISTLLTQTATRPISLDFQVTYSLNKQDIKPSIVPTNALLISQFFGDEFGLGALLNQ